MVILAGEVGGRWSPETAHFMRALAVAKARDVPVFGKPASRLGSAVNQTFSHVQQGALSLTAGSEGWCATNGSDSCSVRRHLCDFVVH